MSVIQSLKQAAQADLKTIVLPEGNDPRVVQAAEMLADEKLVRPILLNGVTDHSGVTVINTLDSTYRPELATLFTIYVSIKASLSRMLKRR